MFLPIGDTPNPKRFTPYVNYGLLAINIAVYLFISLPLSMSTPDANATNLAEYLQYLLKSAPPGLSGEYLAPGITAYDLYLYAHGFKPAAPELTDLIYSLFLHGDFLHLAGNMLFLWIYGDNVEHRLGRWPYLLAYLAWGAIASICYSFFAGNSETPLVGASGAISGVLGFYFVLFPRNKVKVLVLFFPFIMRVFLVPARIVLGVYLILENVFPALLSSGSSVAYGAHIGGFIFGLGFAVGGKKWIWSPKSKPWAKKKTGIYIYYINI